MTARLGPAARALVTDHVLLARRLTRKLLRTAPMHADEEDALSAAYEGLVTAALRFRPEQGSRFTTYAGRRIIGAVRDWMRSVDPLSRDMRGHAHGLEEAHEELRAALGRQATHEELAEHLGLTLGQLDERRRQTQVPVVLAGNLTTGEASPEERHDDKLDVLEMLPDHAAGSATDTHMDMRDVLRAARALLNTRERRFVMLRFREDMLLDEVGEAMGFSQSRACQMERAIVTKLREALRVQAG